MQTLGHVKINFSQCGSIYLDTYISRDHEFIRLTESKMIVKFKVLCFVVANRVLIF